MNTDYAQRLEQFLPKAQELEVFAASASTIRILRAFARMRTWFRLLANLRGDQDTSVLLSAAHSKVIEIWILIPLGLIHSSYAALRTIADICTSYSFYVSHPVEWFAVCEGRVGWKGRASTIKWHIQHTPTCREMNDNFGWSERLNEDYRKLSSYVHGVPVAGLPTLRGIKRTIIPEVDLSKFIKIAERLDCDLSLFFMCVFHKDLVTLSTEDFRTITGGIDYSKLAASGIVLPKV